MLTKIKEKWLIVVSLMIGLTVLVVIGLVFCDVRFLNFFIKLAIESILTVFITLTILEVFQIFEKVSANNFELTKNIFIEIVNNIVNSFGFFNNGISYSNIMPCMCIKSSNIKDKFKDFKIIRTENSEQNKKYIKFLFENYSADIKLLLDWIIPTLKKQAISVNFFKQLNQFEFEILRLMQIHEILLYGNYNENHSALKEDPMNHFSHALKDLWAGLYNEWIKFYFDEE